MSIPSSPATFPAGVQAVTFAIPAGVYTAAVWERNFTGTGTGSITTLAYMDLAGDHAMFPDTSETAGTFDDTIAATTAQIAAINAAAGGNLSAFYHGSAVTVGQTLGINSLTLTLTPPPGGGGNPVGQTVIGNQDIKFSKGYLFGTMANGLADDVPFAELQEITVKFTQSLKELMGPEQLTAIAVGMSEKKVTVTAKAGKVRVRQFNMFAGGAAPTNASGFTTLNLGVNDQPKPFNLHLMSPIDGTDLELKLFGCVSTDFSLPFKLNDFVIPDFTANVYGDGTNIGIIIVPGNQTTS